MARLYLYAFCLDERIATKSPRAKVLSDAVIHYRRPGKVGKP